jgi:RNA polymerase sigma-70 factor, ECF subfamily
LASIGEYFEGLRGYSGNGAKDWTPDPVVAEEDPTGKVPIYRGDSGATVLFGRRIEEKGFESVALPHLQDLFRTAARLLGSASDAEDLVQETYLHAWKSFHRFQPGTNCRAWLFKILFHRILLAFEPPVPEHLSDEDVLSTLEKIPPDFREVVLLADVQEFSYKEIADVLRIPVGTVMSRLSRGRKMLRTELADFAHSRGIKNVRDKGLTS